MCLFVLESIIHGTVLREESLPDFTKLDVALEGLVSI